MPRFTYQAKSLPLQREFGRVSLPSVCSNGPTDPLHTCISCICSNWKILHFYSSFSLLSRNDLFKLISIIKQLCCKRYDLCSFFDKKDPKLSLSELLSRMTRIKINPPHLCAQVTREKTLVDIYHQQL
jgi:hypothetical protein